MNIEIVTCANATLKETGFGTMAACNDVMAVLISQGHTADVTPCASLHDLNAIVERGPDLLILAAKYLLLDDGLTVWYADYFNKNKLLFSGSSRQALRYDSEKILAKIQLARLGINTAQFFMAVPHQYQRHETLPLAYPLFLKPSDAANGNGVDDQSVVENFSQFEAKVASLYASFGQPILVEEYLSGKEFTVAIIKDRCGELTVSAVEIVPPLSQGGLRMLGEKVKASDTELIKTVDIEHIGAVKALAEAAFLGLGIKGFGRIDIKMNAAGQCYFMEANLVPGMNRHSSYFPRACQVANQLTYEEVIERMLDECFSRVIMADLQPSLPVARSTFSPRPFSDTSGSARAHHRN